MIQRFHYGFTVAMLTCLLVCVMGCSVGEKVMATGNDEERERKELERKEQEARSAAYLIDAQTEQLLNNTEEAIKKLKLAIKTDPENDAAYYELAKIYFGSQLYELAEDYILKARHIDPENKWYGILQAEIYLATGKFKEASKVYEELVKKYPADQSLYFDWAYALINQNKLEEAIGVYTLLEQQTGLDENVIREKQKLYLKLGKLEQAAREIQKLIDAFPKNGKYYTWLAEVYKANGEYEKATAVYQKLLEIDEDNPYALLELAQFYREQGEDQQAMEFLIKAFSNPGLDIDSKVAILMPYFNMLNDEKRKEEVFSLLNILVETHPEEAKAHAIYGDFLYNTDQPAQALEEYMKAIALNASVFTVWQQVFFIQSELEDWQGLIQSTEEALDYFPNQPLIYYFKGLAHTQLKQYESAIGILTIGVTMVIDNPQLLAEMYALLGEAYHYTEQYAMSDSAFEKSLRLNPDNPYVLNNYAYYLSLRKTGLDKALEMSKRSLEIQPDNDAFLDTYGWILYQQGKYKEAEVYISKSLEAGGAERGEILEHYGDVLYRLGRIDEAVEYWKKALEKGGHSPGLEQKIIDKKLND